MKSIINTIAIIASLVIIFTIACILVGNLILVIFAIIPAFLFFGVQVLNSLNRYACLLNFPYFQLVIDY